MFHEPHQNSKDPQPRPEPRAKRFQLVKLEERIAPAKGGQGQSVNAHSCGCSLNTCFKC